MRKITLAIMAFLSLASMLSGCFYYPYPYHGYWYERGDGHHRGYYEDRDYRGPRDGDRDRDDRR